MRLPSTRRQLVLCWLFQTLLLVSVQAQRNQVCSTDEECEDGWTCQADYCIPKTCIDRELGALTLQFDPRSYKDMIFKEAGVTVDMLQDTRKEIKDDDQFSMSPPVQRLMNTIHSHSYELTMIGEVMRACQDGTANSGTDSNEEKVSGSDSQESTEETPEVKARSNPREEQGVRQSIGSFVGSLFQAAFNLFGQGETATTPAPTASPSGSPSASSAPSVSSAPSFAPSVSLAPSETPSANPSIMGVSQRTYLGIHMEGGVFIDYSFSLFSESSNATGANDGNGYQFKRGCIGAEIGGGFEASIVIVITSNQYPHDIVGGSLFVEEDIAVGGAFGWGVGAALTGDAFGSDCPFYLEVTFGGGMGFGLGGALCRTGIVIPRGSS